MWLSDVLKLRGVSGLQSLGLLLLLLVATTVCGVSQGVYSDNLSTQESGAGASKFHTSPAIASSAWKVIWFCFAQLGL